MKIHYYYYYYLVLGPNSANLMFIHIEIRNFPEVHRMLFNWLAKSNPNPGPAVGVLRLRASPLLCTDRRC